MKAGWEVKALGSLLEVKNGYAFDSKKFTPDAGTPLIRIRDIKEGKGTAINYNGEYNEEFICKQGDFLIGMDGEFGCYEWKGDPSLLNQRVCRLENFDSGLMSRFLFYGINKYLKEIEAVTGYTTVKHLSSKTIKTIEFPLPPLAEQKRIVSILDEAFEGLDRARENAEANLKSARELFESTANSQLTASSEVKRVALGEVASIPSSLVDPKLPEFLDQPHVGAGNMVTGRDILIDIKTSREEGLKSGKYTFDDNMVLYSKIRPYLRKVARPDFTGLCSADMYPLLPDSSLLDKDYLFHLLLSDDFTSYAIAGSDRAGMPKVNQTHLFKYQLSLPSIKSQKIAVQTIDLAMEKSELLQALYRTKLQDISDLRQSLLQKAFAGELT